MIEELVAFVGLFVLAGALSVAVGIILAGRIGRRLDPPEPPDEATPSPTAGSEDRP